MDCEVAPGFEVEEAQCAVTCCDAGQCEGSYAHPLSHITHERMVVDALNLLRGSLRTYCVQLPLPETSAVATTMHVKFDRLQHNVVSNTRNVSDREYSKQNVNMPTRGRRQRERRQGWMRHDHTYKRTTRVRQNQQRAQVMVTRICTAVLIPVACQPFRKLHLSNKQAADLLPSAQLHRFLLLLDSSFGC